MSQHHLMSSVTKLRALWYDRALCVRCGVTLSEQRIRHSLNHGLCPCCSDCAPNVKKELLEAKSAGWPTETAHPPTPAWCGGWRKDVASDTWRQE